MTNLPAPIPPVNGDFVVEGYFFALPASFPGVSRVVKPEECRVHRLALSSRGDLVFGATAGPRPHVIQWAPKGTYGYAVDLGVPEGALEIDAMASTSTPGKNLDRLFLAAWDGKRTVIWQWVAPLIGHGIQEWNVVKFPPEALCSLPGTRITDMAWEGEGGRILAMAGQSCLWFSPADGHGLAMGGMDLPESHPNLLRIRPDALHVLARDGELYRVDMDRCCLVREGKWIPDAECGLPQQCISGSGWIVGVDERGQVSEWKGSTAPAIRRGTIPLSPVQGLCRLTDGRIFASAGLDITHWFVLGEGGGCARDLGVPVSTLTARRYGVQLGNLTVGSGGEIYLAENDRGGHLWIYFPANAS